VTLVAPPNVSEVQMAQSVAQVDHESGYVPRPAAAAPSVQSFPTVHTVRIEPASAADRLTAGLGRALAEAAGRDRPWPGCRPPSEPLLGWLRGLVHPQLHTPAFEAALATRFGPDLFGLGRLPQPPDFLAGLDFAALPAEHVAPFLRRISLTRPAPTPDQLTPDALAAEPGPVSAHRRTAEQREWGRPAGAGAPLLPETTAIPRIVHRIWLGGPVPATSGFLRNCAADAAAYRGEVDFFLWTDVPRTAFQDPAAPAAELLAWARDNGIHLINVFEIFHAGNPMLLHVPYVLEMCKQLPRGYAAASDHLRVELMYLFGGAYVDGDIRLDSDHNGGPLEQTLPELLDEVAAGPFGFTLSTPPFGGIGNDAVYAPAGHPALRLWLELARVNYYRTQSQIFGGIALMARPFVGKPHGLLRYEAPNRSGRIHHTVLRRLGLTRESLVPTMHACTYGSETTWIPPRGGEPVAARTWTGPQVAETLRRAALFLAWQLHAREGNLYLSAAAPVIAGLPDPGAAWTALLRFLGSLRGSIPEVTSITELRWHEDRRPEYVDLPPETESLLDRECDPAAWLGHEHARDRRVWLLDELVTPVALREALAESESEFTARRVAATEDCPAPADRLSTLLDQAGEPAGIRLRSGGAPGPAHPAAPLTVPPGHVGVQLEGRFGEAWLDGRRVRPDHVARLLRDTAPGTGPCVLAMSWGAQNGPRSFAARLAALTGRPVHATAGRMLVRQNGAPLVLTSTIDETCRSVWGAGEFLEFAPDGAITPSRLRSTFRAAGIGGQARRLRCATEPAPQRPEPPLPQ
jgi:hypothetical protein